MELCSLLLGAGWEVVILTLHHHHSADPEGITEQLRGRCYLNQSPITFFISESDLNSTRLRMTTRAPNCHSRLLQHPQSQTPRSCLQEIEDSFNSRGDEGKQV